MGDQGRVKVQCQACAFSQVVTPEDDETPAELIIEHGRETGHTLAITLIDE